MSSRRGRLLPAILVLAMLFAACGGGESETPETTVEETTEQEAPPPEGGTLSVSAVDNSFNPATLSVSAGDEVTVDFTNDGQNPHTFTSDDLGFDSGTVQPGESASVTFTAPDEATEFICSIHGGSGMTGEITPA